MGRGHLDKHVLDTIFHECRQCGTCCTQYRKILLAEDEVEFIKKMGGHVGVNVSMNSIREKGLKEARREAQEDGKVYMIHPDDKGCMFLQKRDGKYYCKIYNYRPKTCQGFRCNMADNSFLNLFGGNATSLLGQDAFGLPTTPKKTKE